MLDYIISEKDIVEINKSFSDGVLKNQGLMGCYSSIYYYDSKELSVCSVFRSICKNHYFTDGNKRTACSCLFILCQYNDIEFKLTDSQLEKIALDISSNHYSTEEICKKIFNN